MPPRAAGVATGAAARVRGALSRRTALSLRGQSAIKTERSLQSCLQSAAGRRYDGSDPIPSSIPIPIPKLDPRLPVPDFGTSGNRIGTASGLLSSCSAIGLAPGGIGNSLQWGCSEWSPFLPMMSPITTAVVLSRISTGIPQGIRQTRSIFCSTRSPIFANNFHSNRRSQRRHYSNTNYSSPATTARPRYTASNLFSRVHPSSPSAFSTASSGWTSSPSNPCNPPSFTHHARHFHHLSRPRRAPPKDPWTTVGVARGSSKEEIRKQYLNMAKKLHPDRNPGDKGAEQKFKELQAAYENIKDGKEKQPTGGFGGGQGTSGSGGGERRYGAYGARSWEEHQQAYQKQRYGNEQWYRDEQSRQHQQHQQRYGQTPYGNAQQNNWRQGPNPFPGGPFGPGGFGGGMGGAPNPGVRYLSQGSGRMTVMPPGQLPPGHFAGGARPAGDGQFIGGQQYNSYNTNGGAGGNVPGQDPNDYNGLNLRSQQEGMQGGMPGGTLGARGEWTGGPRGYVGQGAQHDLDWELQQLAKGDFTAEDGKGDAGHPRESEAEMHRRRQLLAKREAEQRSENARKTELARDQNRNVLSQKEGAGTDAYLQGQSPSDIQSQQMQYEQQQLLHAQQLQSQQYQAQQVQPNLIQRHGRDQGTPPERRYGEGRVPRESQTGGGESNYHQQAGVGGQNAHGNYVRRPSELWGNANDGIDTSNVVTDFSPSTNRAGSQYQQGHRQQQYQAFDHSTSKPQRTFDHGCGSDVSENENLHYGGSGELQRHQGNRTVLNREGH